MVKSSFENISVILKRETRATIKATAKTIATSKRLATATLGSESESLCSNLFLLLFIVFVSLVRYSFYRLALSYHFVQIFQVVHFAGIPALFHLQGNDADGLAMTSSYHFSVAKATCIL